MTDGVAPPRGATTCFRHPDRMAGVGCQRCSRPICPQCMVQAQVGFQCPECAHVHSQQVLQGRAAFSSRGVTDIVVGKALIGLNVVAYVLTVLTGRSTTATGWLVSDGVVYGPAVAHGEWWRLVSGAFLHASPLHLLMNMFL
ncbi:MAG: rhomboid family intramembrane serine protease, partial [Actinobacteria bacterium]|nr:rhomboid family intramembrane serine protease [Actinomycetota bacterium]